LVETKIHKAAVENRAAIVKKFIPEINRWIEINMDHAVEKGWMTS